ncbi:MAG TPA: hypothetical protein EYP90_03665, partial [Chromatiaceae bacterium]|nr:hypothetical protein [Chromatiaceae bacterium]
MSIFGLVAALILPAILGFSWLYLLWRNSHIAAKIGYGYFLGIFAITIILKIWDRIGYMLDFTLISALVVILTAIPLLLKAGLSINAEKPVPYIPFLSVWEKLIWGLVIAILVIRYGGIILEVIWRPLYPWDAWMNWAPKAKTWFELKEIVPFVGHSNWAIENTRNNVYTLGNPFSSAYPPLVPLIQAWTALGQGVWVDNLVNIPWVLCSVALGFAFYGQGRMLGARAHVTMVIVYLMLCMPFINVHTALAGYADLWLAAFYGLSVMAFINWSLTKNKTQAVLMFIFALACIQTKNPGIIWSAILLPPIVLTLLPGRWRYIFLVSALIGFIMWYYLGGFSVKTAGIGTFTITPNDITLPGVGSFLIEYHQVQKAFILNDLIWDNWHIFGWLVLVMFVPVGIKNIWNLPLLAPSILLLGGFLFIFVVFFFTSHYKSAIDNTTIN